ncbi:hypothetical protein [Paenibacillus ihuae]|uniref:hypothetical protein n=1 Tax=Paenibacillus ihuae TaxID=1232431 RepID=UPI0006D542E6|nr:hypothetical protein [Paenibacillus ihuae]
MADNTSSNNVNKDILVGKLGLEQYRNTNIYKKNGVFVISPSSQNSYGWFDVRKVNLDRYDSNRDKGHLIVRFQDKLLWADLNDFITNTISEERIVYTSSIGIHWKFNVIEHMGRYSAVNRTSKQSQELTLKDEKELSTMLELECR